MGKVVALDYGEARVGVAAADGSVGVATGRETIRWEGRKDLRHSLEEVAEQEGPERWVVGFPLNMDGSRGPRCEAVEAFARRLVGWFGRPVVLWDERLTSAQADRVRRRAGVREERARAQGSTDRAAATLILQSWLDAGDRSGVDWSPHGDVEDAGTDSEQEEE